MQSLNLRKLFLATSLLSMLTLLPFQAVKAIEYGGFGGRPAYPQADNPRTESIFVHTLEPGARQEEGVLVVNNTPETKTLLVFAADSTPSSGGAFACKQLVEPKTDVGNWITLAKSEVTLAPGTNEIVPFTILVPNNAGVGEHDGCVLIQEKKDPVPGQTGAVLSVRTGLRVAITVPGEIVRKLQISGFTIDRTGTGFLLHPLVKNNGNVSIDANVKVVTRYFFGLILLRHEGQYPILRGETSEWNFELPRPFWGGLYRSSFTVEYDEHPEAVVGVNSGKTMTQLIGRPVWFFSLPTPLGLVIELTVLALIILTLWFFIFGKNKNKKKISKKVR